MSNQGIVTQVYTTDEDMFTFLYEFDYSQTPVKVSVTIGAGGQPSSPPTSPPASGMPPQTYVFDRNNQVFFDLESPEENFIEGWMKIVSLNNPAGGDDAGILCDFFFGPRLYHHFDGINITFRM